MRMVLGRRSGARAAAPRKSACERRPEHRQCPCKGRLVRRRGQARMILTVHDELVCECPAEEADDVQALMREHMSGAAHLSVPLDVDVGIGTNWKDAKP